MKPIPNFPGYFATEDGGIFSLKTNDPYKRVVLKEPRQLKPKTTNHGYKMVVLTVEGKKFCRMVHQLILETFVGPRPAGMFACHGPKGKIDDSISNLYWETPQHNTLDRYRDNTMTYGKNHHSTKLTDSNVVEIRQRYAKGGISQAKLAVEYGVHQSIISDVVHRITWKHIL